MTSYAVIGRIAKRVAEALAAPALKKVMRTELVAGVLAKLGYRKLENDFESIYVHTLVVRRSQGAALEALHMFKNKRVVKTFRDGWRDGDPAAFEENVRVHAAAFSADSVFADIDALTECRAFHAVFTNLAKEAISPGDQNMTNMLITLSAQVTEMQEQVATANQPGPDAMTPAREAEVFEKYLQDLRSETYRIEIKGIYSESGAGRQPAYFPIEEHYTPLKAVSGAGPEAEEGGEQDEKGAVEMQAMLRLQRGKEEKKPALSEFLSQGKHLLIIGDPGSGKTTFVRFVACVLAKDRLGDTAAGRNEHLGLPDDTETPTPVFLRISHLAACLRDNQADVSGGRTWHWLVAALEEPWGREAAAVLQQKLNAGNCFVLLDGLDEVADEGLARDVFRVVNAAVEHWGRNRFVVTSRPFGYRAVAGIEDMQSIRISQFGNEEILEFINRWVTAIYPDEDERNREAYLPQLRSAVLQKPRIRRLARNPVMLTCLCAVHWNESHLPEGKAQLLAGVLRWLVNAREKERAELGFNNFFAEECFRTLAYAMTAHDEGKQVGVDLLWAARQLEEPFRDQMRIAEGRRQSEARRFLESEMINSGIVIQDKTGDLRFWHLSFQEHYAGRTLVGLDRSEWWDEVKDRLYDPQWNEVIDHFAGSLITVPSRRSVDSLIQQVIEQAPGDLRSKARMVAVVGRLLKLLGVYEYAPPPALGWQEILVSIRGVFDADTAKAVPAAERIAAAEVLGWSGDPRFDTAEPEMLSIPGQSGMLLSKYPVTVQEYRVFVENGGYGEPQFWGKWWSVREKEEWEAPDDWEDQLEHRNRPVTGVSWYEAGAYCKWLARNTGNGYRLSKSDEWEAAATSSAGDYPWGKAKPSEELLNFDGSVGCPTPVGVYPAGAAPGGHLDMAGNVWEWCEDLYKKGGSSRVLRGGSWGNSAGLCRSAFRFSDPPDARYDFIGFRLSRSLP